MSQLKVNSIKGLNVPATGPQIDIGNTGDISLNNSNVTNVNQANVTTANITTNNVTTENVTTLNVTNSLDLRNANQFSVPTGTTAERPSSPSTGTIRYNSETGKPEFWTGSTWKNFTVQRFTEELASGSGNWSVPSGVSSVEIMVVAGGGSGGSGTGGGGGAGGVVYSSGYPVTPGGTISYSVGSGHGGTGQGQGQTGQNTTFGSITAYGGGGGGSTYPPDRGVGKTGGSGGGGAQYPVARNNAGAANQPGKNPLGTDYGNAGAPGDKGGGGGAGGAGSGNIGGTGVSLTLGETTYAVGGGGMGQSDNPGALASNPFGGGGNDGNVGFNAAANKGGGGGAGWGFSGGRRGAGGPGIIVISYLG